MDGKNKLYFGDNLKILREYVPDASVDLIYLDPPFNSSATYNVFVAPTFRSAHTDAHLKVGATASGEESAAQIMAFQASVAPLYERRRRRSQTGATVEPGGGGGVQGNSRPRAAQARRGVVKLVTQDPLLNLAGLAFQETTFQCRKSERRDLRYPFCYHGPSRLSTCTH